MTSSILAWASEEGFGELTDHEAGDDETFADAHQFRLRYVLGLLSRIGGARS